MVVATGLGDQRRPPVAHWWTALACSVSDPGDALTGLARVLSWSPQESQSLS
ncbi:hypothetical protein [Actinomadura litoris]|uniref:hypothetical protein n=1 Tax=Actinomadura litoris TaxID=2678616 RepID=UPI0015643901|nr:hypothetical protein [Actinomadura litoris]